MLDDIIYDNIIYDNSRSINMSLNDFRSRRLNQVRVSLTRSDCRSEDNAMFEQVDEQEELYKNAYQRTIVWRSTPVINKDWISGVLRLSNVNGVCRYIRLGI